MRAPPDECPLRKVARPSTTNGVRHQPSLSNDERLLLIARRPPSDRRRHGPEVPVNPANDWALRVIDVGKRSHLNELTAVDDSSSKNVAK